jgi:ankyrin repeat protein
MTKKNTGSIARAAALTALLAAPAISLAQEIPALIEAVRNGELETTRLLLARGNDVNTSQGDGATALHWAAHRDDLVSAGLLIESGADVNAANQLGATPLWLAAINGANKLAALLLEAGANPDVELRMGETPLMAASRTGNLPTVEMLLEHGAEVDRAERERGQTALMWAAAQRHTDVVRLLIANGADVNARSTVWYQLENTAGNTNPSGNFRMAHGGSTPLLFAARNGHIETARVLLEAGAELQDTDASGASVLVTATHSGHGALASFLLQQGADVNAAGAGYTALHAAVLRSQIDLVTELLERGADLNAAIEHGSAGRRFSADYSIRHQLIGMNALWLAAKYGEVEILQTLLDWGADPLFVSDSGVTLLQLAMGNSGSTLEFRRDRIPNALPDHEEEERLTLELARILIGLGVDVNAADDRGFTALHHAVLKDFDRVVEFLIDQGADIHAVTQRDQTPLLLAETPQTIPGSNGLRGTRPEVAILLRRLGASE